MAKSSSKSKQAYYAQYKLTRRWESNRKRKLLRTQKQQPNNKQIELALQSIGYRRKTPTTRMWSAQWVQTAMLFKRAQGRFDPQIMSNNQDAAKAALNKASLLPVKQKRVSEKDFFTIGTQLLHKQQ
jgi:hypothetical protein